MSTDNTYLVRFCDVRFYRIRLTATSEDEAATKAENLYTDENEHLFELEPALGGTDDWLAEEVRS